MFCGKECFSLALQRDVDKYNDVYHRCLEDKIANEDLLKIAMVISCYKGNTLEKVKKRKQYQEEYHRVLNHYIHEGERMGLVTSCQLTNYFRFLLTNGYLSKNGKPFYHITPDAPRGLEFVSVFNSKGACLEFSQVFADFLNLAGVNASPIICNVSNIEKGSLNYARNTLKVSPYSEEKLQEMASEENYFDHYVTLIEENSSYLIADMTNDLNFKVEDLNHASLIDGKALMYMNPFASFLERINKKEEDVLSNFILNDTYTMPYSVEKIRSERENCNLVLEKEQEKIETCYLENKKDIKHLAKVANKIKIKKMF